jgi:hypothetical protein
MRQQRRGEKAAEEFTTENAEIAERKGAGG